MKTKIAYGSLDIGTSHISAAISIRKEPGKLELISLASEPLHAMKQGVITNLESVSETIRQVLTKAEMIAGISAPPLTVSVTTAQSQGFQSHGIVAVAGVGSHGEREVTLSDIERVVEMANSVSIPSERVLLHSIPYRFLVDHTDVEEPHGTSGIRLESEVYLVTHHKNILENLNKAISKAGYKTEEVVLQSIASAEGVIGEDERKMGTLLIDIGGAVTDYVFMNNGGIVLSGFLPIGADHITKDLAYGLKTTLQHAEDLKIRHGHIREVNQTLPHTDNAFITVPLASQNRTARVPKRVLGQIIEPRVSEILLLVKKNIETELKEQQQYSSVVLTGGGALTQDITEIAEDLFQLPCRIGKPLITSTVEESIHSPAYATLIGLQKMALEKWERTHKEPTPLAPALNQEELRSPSIAKLGHYFKNLFH